MLRNFCFSLVTQRHFAKVLNSIDVGIAGDCLESSLLQLKVFVPSYRFSLCTVLSFAANRRMRTLSTSVVPSGWFAGIFLFSVMVPCPFLSRFFGAVFVMCDWWTLLDDVDQYVNSFWTFRYLYNCNFCSAHDMDAYVLTLRLQLM